MTSFASIVRTPGGDALRLAALLLVIAQLYICIVCFRQRRGRTAKALAIAHFVLGFLLLFFLLDGTHSPVRYHPDQPRPYPLIDRAIYALPWAAILVFELASAALLAFAGCNCLRHARTHLSPGAIKQAMDELAAGICIAEDSGLPVMVNLRMNELSLALTGGTLIDAEAFWQRIRALGEDENGQVLVSGADGTVLLFARGELRMGRQTYRQFTAVDVTEQYRITKALRDNNEKLRDLQLRMKAWSAEASDLAMRREILNARATVHDEVGHVLLRGSYYMQHPNDAEEEALLALLKQTNSTLLYEAEQPDDAARDPVQEALRMARAIGLNAVVEGDAPADEPRAALLGQAIRECAANAVKHAGANALRVELTASDGKSVIRITNNGTPPAEPVREAGGLRSLRLAVESAGGVFRVESSPAFLLTLVLPEAKNLPASPK